MRLAEMLGGSTGLRRQLPHVAVALGLAAWVVYWVQQGLGDMMLGPHRYDDFRYADRAIRGTFDSAIRSRYVHVWTLRAFYGLISDRVLAAAAYAASVHAGLTVLAYFLGVRAGGRLAGVFAALLVPFYPPLLNFISTPLTDPPCALYAGAALLSVLPGGEGSGRQPGPLRAVFAGLLCFASIKCKETGLAVVPVVAFVLWQSRSQRFRLWGYLAAGALLGQVGLCVVDGLITGDPFQSLRISLYESYGKAIASTPKRSNTGRNLMRKDWMELFTQGGIRDFSLCAIAGVLLGYRRQHAIRVLSLWALASLLFMAWVTWRYAGIDAHIRYLGVFGLPCAVAAGYAMAEVCRWTAPTTTPTSPDDGKPQRAPTEGRDGWLVWACAAASAWIAFQGLTAGYAQLHGTARAYAVKRAAFFLLPLVAPLCVALAAMARNLWLRRGAALCCVAAIVLSALPVSYNYVRYHGTRLSSWRKLAHMVEHEPISAIVRYRIKRKRLLPGLVQWRIMALTSLPSDRQFPVDDAKSVETADRRALLVVDHHRKAAAREARDAGWQEVLELRKRKRRFRVFRHESQL